MFLRSLPIRKAQNSHGTDALQRRSSANRSPAHIRSCRNPSLVSENDVTVAEEKVAEYEAKLRGARTQIYQEQEAWRKQLLDEQSRSVAQAREEAKEQIQQAKADLSAQLEQSRQVLSRDAEGLAEQIVQGILKGSKN